MCFVIYEKECSNSFDKWEYYQLLKEEEAKRDIQDYKKWKKDVTECGANENGDAPYLPPNIYFTKMSRKRKRIVRLTNYAIRLYNSDWKKLGLYLLKITEKYRTGLPSVRFDDKILYIETEKDGSFVTCSSDFCGTTCTQALGSPIWISKTFNQEKCTNCKHLKIISRYDVKDFSHSRRFSNQYWPDDEAHCMLVNKYISHVNPYIGKEMAITPHWCPKKT